ncbi:MAG: bifunctional riboflavin kinase/FAD synthetase [Proteobacteria bacterium]|nr:bifunctional riboflavin kinase/FAD synthetase [Pseudomonadota bacterium]
MRLLRDLPATATQPLALTIGNFDGVHRGHQAMLARLVEAAEDLALAPAVLTFDPHPREYFARKRAGGTTPPMRLSALRGKAGAFREAGVATMIVARFDDALATLEADAFVDDVLVRRLGVRWALVGDDFRFGRGRTGDVTRLRALARTFTVEAMAPIVVDGVRASSTAVRDALVEGRFEAATSLLGRPYRVEGRVMHGRKLGRSLGFPTANLALRHPPPLAGIFVVTVHGVGDGPRDAVASLGTRPTISDGLAPLLEVHLLDFDGDLYGRRLAVDFLAKLRDEARYDDLATLKAQIAADVAATRHWFASRARHGTVHA